jgi:hypothetical protein
MVVDGGIEAWIEQGFLVLRSALWFKIKPLPIGLALR